MGRRVEEQLQQRNGLTFWEYNLCLAGFAKALEKRNELGSARANVVLAPLLVTNLHIYILLSYYFNLQFLLF